MHKINTKKLKPGLVASYHIRPGSGEGLFLFRRFINFHLHTYSLTYSRGTHTGHSNPNLERCQSISVDLLHLALAIFVQPILRVLQLAQE